jgi:hypothetical protein
MSANFDPQPPITGPSTGSMHAPRPPVPVNTGGSYVATAAKQYYSGGVRFAAGTTMDEELQFTTAALSSAPSTNGYLFGTPLTRCGVISLWVQYTSSAATTSGWPRIGQNGPFSVTAYFGTDPAHPTMGNINVQLVALPDTAISFAPGAT